MSIKVANQSAWAKKALQDWQWHQVKDRPSSFSSWRDIELNKFIEQGFPTRKLEQWKYTDLGFLQDCHFKAPTAPVDKIDIEPYKLDESCRLVFVNGIYMPLLSDLQGLPNNISIANASSLSSEDFFLYTTEQTRIVSHDPAVVSLNAALSFDGAFVCLADNCELDRIIHILHINTKLEIPYMHHPRHVIILGENATASIVEQHVGFADASYLSNVVTQVRLKTAAQCTYYKLQQESNKAYHLASVQVDQHSNSCWQGYYAGFGSQLNRDDLVMDLVGVGACCSMQGFYHIQGKQHFDMHTYTNHLAEHTNSTQEYKGLLAQQSHGVFNGKIHIYPGANQTKAGMNNHNLLLNQGVSVDTKPELEIYADDVQCSHGATVGQVDDEVLFYLRSRGLSEEEARDILSEAFLNEIIDQFPSEQVKRLVRAYRLL